mgnify:CR=1 FL=1
MNFNMNPNSELVQSAVNVPNLVPVPDALISQAREFQMAMMMYTCAIREVKTKLEVLNDELSVRNQRNPIEVIKSRVKKPMSIVEKLQRRNLPVSLESMMQNLDDIAGIRVVCSFVDDIYAVANMLVSQDDITVITIKDYIKHQFRTIAMDFWASLDHQLKYKKDIGDVSDQISEELRQCAETIAATDQRMLNIRRSIESQGAFSDKYGKALSPILET